MGQLQQFLKRSASKPEIYPLFIILGGALTGAVYMGTHQARAPDVVWNHKTNAEPWQSVKDGDQVKLATINQKYERRYNRKEW
ncbi:MAG: NADH-ubiquinone reductase complex 1 MLRQ subunit-domain-containing protein [Benjaminiella poitrasii]|nr:MAG: NADH-ubiquinone reductase complex 1 MLRQ subunit-domain-containing protein [Benjaminiella poitrasii]